jgi:FemAB-related protein (PEP-CTERM system-associated)
LTSIAIPDSPARGKIGAAAEDLAVDSACDRERWDAYVRRHPEGGFCHLWSVAEAIRRAYGHRVIRLAVFRGTAGGAANAEGDGRRLPSGVLTCVQIRHVIFGNRLVSLPFFDYGGVLSDDAAAHRALIEEARRIGSLLGAAHLEIRHRTPPRAGEMDGQLRFHKVRMVRPLPGSSTELMRSFKSKLRSQVTKAQREGLKLQVGGAELLDRFYGVFAVNMRDLGSPVHSKALIAAFLDAFPEAGRVFLVYREGRPLAGSVAFGFKETVVNPWASSLRAFSRLNPNMLLYWGMLQYACDHGYRAFDFGRSTPGEGTFRFKEQWGGQPEPSPWQFIALNSRAASDGGSLAATPAFRLAGKVWQRLPVELTRLIGPPLRKYISL